MSLSSSELNQRFRTGTKLTIKRFVQNEVNMYNDNWCYIIMEELSRQVSEETLKKYKFLATQELNVLKRVVNDLSVVYKEPAARRAVIEGKEINTETGDKTETSQESDVYEDAIKDTNKDEALQAINQYTNLSNNTLLKVTYRNGKLDYDVFLFSNAEIYTDPDDWKEIIAVKYYNGLNIGGANGNYGSYGACGGSTPVYMPTMKYDDSVQGIGLTPIQEYHSAVLWVKKDIKNNGLIENGTVDETLQGGKVYTIEPFGELERVVSEKDIPYLDDEGEPILPFVLYNRVYPIDTLLNFTAGNDIRDLNVDIAILLIWLNSVEKFQSFKQIVFNTDNPDAIPSSLKTGPADIIVNPTGEGGGSVEVLDLTSDTKTKYESIEKRIITVLAGYGISPENFTMSAAPTSGFSLKISNIGKIEARKKQLPLYRKREKEIYDIERTIWNHHEVKQMPDDAELEVDFAEMEFPKDPDEQIKQDEFNLRHNIETEIDILKRHNPDLTDDTALEQYKENKAFNEANQPAPIEIAQIKQPGANNAENNQGKGSQGSQGSQGGDQGQGS